MRLTRKARAELQALQKRYPGEVELLVATRNAARLYIRGMEWDFAVVAGELSLHQKRNAPDDLYALAFYRAKEAISAVRLGHREAAARKAEARSARLREAKCRPPAQRCFFF